MFVPLYDHNPLRRVRRPYVNWSIIAVTVALFLMFQTGGVADEGALARALAYGVKPAFLFDGVTPPRGYGSLPEWSTLVTYAFVHADFQHIAGNMLFLWVFGDNVEDATGHVRYALFFALSAAAAALAYAAFASDSTAPLVGASGAVAAVIAAYLMLHPRVKVWVLVLWRVPLRVSAFWPLLVWILLQVVYLATGGGSDVAWWAHIGGFVAGGVLIVGLKRRDVSLFDRGL